MISWPILLGLSNPDFGDNSVGKVQYLCWNSVRLSEDTFELLADWWVEECFRRCSGEAVERLVIIPSHEDPFHVLGPAPDQLELDRREVLDFIEDAYLCLEGWVVNVSARSIKSLEIGQITVALVLPSSVENRGQ